MRIYNATYRGFVYDRRNGVETMKVFFTDRELGVLALALVKCDLLSDMGVLQYPWCDDHDDDETLWILTKMDKMTEETK